MDLQKQAPIEGAFHQEDMRRRLAVVAQEQAEARSKVRREHEAAATLLRTLRSSGQIVDAELADGLSRRDPASLAAGFQLLSATPSGAETTTAREFAARLRDAEPAKMFAAWVARQPALEEDPAIERIEARSIRSRRSRTRMPCCVGADESRR